MRRLNDAWANELAFLLRALARVAPEPLIARVLMQADHDWPSDPNLGRVVAFAPWAPGVPPGEKSLAEAARAALARDGEPQQIVRRYRREPSPLVRDTARGRTGRLDRVLGGEFDVVP